MSNNFFGQFLLEKGVISKSQLLTAIDLQNASHFSLGQIAIRKGYLTRQEAEVINLEQQRTDQRFGALAVSMELLKGRQVSELFITQQKARKFFGEVLIEENVLSQASLTGYLQEHEDLKRQSSLRLNSNIYSHQNGALIADIINTTARMFSRVIKMQLHVSEVLYEDVEIGAQELAIHQSAELPKPIKTGFIMHRKLITSLANKFLDMDVSDNPEVCEDAVKELLNIVLGNSQVGHDKKHKALSKLAPPQVSKPGVDLKAAYKSVLNIQVSVPDHSFVLFLYTD